MRPTSPSGSDGACSSPLPKRRLLLFYLSTKPPDLIAHFIIVCARIIVIHWQAKLAAGQSPDGGQQVVAGNHLVTLGTHQIDLCIEEFLLRIEDIEHRARSDGGLLVDALQRDVRGMHLRFQRFDARPRRNQSFPGARSEEHTSELQSLMRISYAVFCLKKKTTY